MREWGEKREGERKERRGRGGKGGRGGKEGGGGKRKGEGREVRKNRMWYCLRRELYLWGLTVILTGNGNYNFWGIACQNVRPT